MNVALLFYGLFGSIIIINVVKIVNSRHTIKLLSSTVDKYLEKMAPIISRKESFRYKQENPYFNRKK